MFVTPTSSKALTPVALRGNRNLPSVFP